MHNPVKMLHIYIKYPLIFIDKAKNAQSYYFKEAAIWNALIARCAYSVIRCYQQWKQSKFQHFAGLHNARYRSFKDQTNTCKLRRRENKCKYQDSFQPLAKTVWPYNKIYNYLQPL